MNAWMLRPRPHHIYRMQEFQQQNMVAIGWVGTGDLTGMPRETLRQKLQRPPYQLQGMSLGGACAMIDAFVNQMQIGDLILMPDGEDIYFAEITGDYRYHAEADDDRIGCPHQRTVMWLERTTRGKLPAGLRSALKAPRTVTNLTEYLADIEAFAHGNTEGNHSVQEVSVSYPLRPDYNISFAVPTDMTPTEAERLSIFVKSLYFA